MPRRGVDEQERNAALLHQLDHLARLNSRLGVRSMIAVVLADPELSRPARYLGELLRRVAEAGQAGPLADRLDWVEGLVKHRSKRHRRAVLLHEHVGLITVNEMFDRTDAMRWLKRVAHHVERITHYDRAAGMAGPEAP